MNTAEFLDIVWGDRHGWVDVPSKINGHWVPANVEWPDDRAMVLRRIESCLVDDEDAYFSVAQFRSRGRRIMDVLPTRWLWADLDRVDPVFLDEDGVLPTVAWESSPGRYQCLWLLTRELEPAKQTVLNRRLTRAIGADAGGYDLTQVLRPPGTLNHKYDPPAEVELLWYNPSITYKVSEMVELIHAIENENGTHAHPTTAARVPSDIALSQIPARARRLLATPESMVVTGERSAQLWQLECMLAEAGFTVDQIHALVKPTAWNKHKELRDGDAVLEREIRKAIAHVGSKQSTPTPRARELEAVHHEGASHDRDEGKLGRRERSPFVDYATFLGTNINTPRWLIQDIWSAASHGIVGGEPKTSKSTFAMAMAVAVATGTPFLGKYEVPRSGPVIMIQEENAPWVVQDRLRKLSSMAGLINPNGVEISVAPKGSIMENVVRLDFPKEAPLKLLNNWGFDLTEDADLEMLEEEVRSEGAVMVILDPLYLLMGGTNINSQHEIGPMMQWLMALRYNHNCAVVLVHHWHKATENSKLRRPGQRLMGSGLLHGWVESGVYMEAMGFSGEGRLDVRVEREFRNVAPMGPLDVGWTMGEPGGLDMTVDVSDAKSVGASLDDVLAGIIGGGAISLKQVSDALGESGVAMSRPALRDALVKRGYVLESRKQGTGTAWWVVEKTPEGGSDDS